jgi:hypothetical protein
MLVDSLLADGIALDSELVPELEDSEDPLEARLLEAALLEVRGRPP